MMCSGQLTDRSFCAVRARRLIRLSNGVERRNERQNLEGDACVCASDDTLTYWLPMCGSWEECYKNHPFYRWESTNQLTHKRDMIAVYQLDCYRSNH